MRPYLPARTLALCVVAWTCVHAQEALEVVWERSLGEDGRTEFAKEIVVARDGGYVACGWGAVYDGFSAHPTDALLVKLDPDGEIDWWRYHGDEGSQYFYGLTRIGDDGYAGVGESLPAEPFGTYGAYLVLTNLGGTATYERLFFDEGGLVAQGTDIQRTRDGGFIVAGYSPSTVAGEGTVPCLLKTASDGHMAWIAPCVHGTYGRLSAVRQLPDGDFVALGSTVAPEAAVNSCYLVRTDDSGRLRWIAVHDEPEGCWGNALEVTDEGDFVVAGSIGNIEGALLVGFSSAGAERWATVPFRGHGYSANVVCELRDGGFLIVGNAPSTAGGQYRTQLIRSDARGHATWLGGLEGHFFGLAQGDDGSILLAGNIRREDNDNDARFVKIAAPRVAFRRGWVNADAALDLSDAVCVLEYLFHAGGSTCTTRVGDCLDAADSNDDGAVDISDPILVLHVLFIGAPGLSEPAEACGHDPTSDDLTCTSSDVCRYAAP